MAVVGFTLPTATQLEEMSYNQSGGQTYNNVVPPPGKKFAVVLLQLGDAVTRANYPAIGTAIDAIAGIDGVQLIIDSVGLPEDKVPPTAPEGMERRLYLSAHLRLNKV